MRKTASVLICIVITISLCSCKSPHKHNWVEANCTSPRMCLDCNATEGEPLGHVWEDATCTEPKTCKVCGATDGEPLGHSWEDATCTSPKTCSVCGETEGDPIPHNWKEATCTEPKTCTLCGVTEGEPAGHQSEEWKTIKKATCAEEGQESAQCTVCGQEVTRSIEKLPHETGDWIVEKEATYTEQGVRVKKCKNCGEVIERQDYQMTEEEALKWLKKTAKTGLYDKISRDPDQYKGEYVKFSGKVVQVCFEAGTADEWSEYRIATKNGYDDVIYVGIQNYGKSRILEGDKVTVYGISGGLYSYQTVRGDMITIPLVYAIVYE